MYRYFQHRFNHFGFNFQKRKPLFNLSSLKKKEKEDKKPKEDLNGMQIRLLQHRLLCFA